mgnify:CR=1 FL=1
MKGSQTVHKKMSVAYYMVPAVAFTAIALSNFISNSFGIYLKYQALTDSYYEHKLNEKYQDMKDMSKDENKQASIAS